MGKGGSRISEASVTPKRKLQNTGKERANNMQTLGRHFANSWIAFLSSRQQPPKGTPKKTL
eukprot:474723-Amphidinium_carterae.1